MTTSPFATLAESVSFWSEYPSVLTDAWNALSDADQLSYLVMATKELDSLRWQGFKLYSSQEHQFPRKYKIDPNSISPYGILMVYYDPFGYLYEQNDIATPYYPSGYWALNSDYKTGNIVFGTATQATYQASHDSTGAANNEPGVGALWASYWSRLTGYPQSVKNACILEAKALMEFFDPEETSARDRWNLQIQGVTNAHYGNTGESYSAGSRTINEGLRSDEAYQLIEKYLEKSILIT
jgi:hypothetical protein